ncbi:adventurous gliding motility protein AgmC [Corallococcus macrosporus]|uniref:Ig-like domain-containing protein n=1 Tax=Corallococcus macrosporus DSM 14697 TaxID=1189310 RepID=A0A250JZY5_9BACT|nr:Ig-like domain-containing protein [Corallococcus macrosporus]ATB49057.1 hypothetical protein MYMAC_004695 [Corallococcus macrosporus DSM 14697]
MRTNALTKVLMAAVGLWALPALPGPDTYLVGNGQDGARTVSAAGGVEINNYAQVKAPLAPGDMTITTSLATNTSTSAPVVPRFRGPAGGGDTAGDLVLIIQTTGVVPVTVPGSPGPIYLEGGAVGRWELARLTAVVEDEAEEELLLTLDRPLKHSYADGVTQVVRVPEYTSLTLNNNAVVRAKAWNPVTRTGGILAFMANGAVNLGNGSQLSAEGRGFRGGSYEEDTEEDGEGDPFAGCPGSTNLAGTRARAGEGIDVTHPDARGVENVANGGGGGVCVRAGGGGGGNTGAGGRGGNSADGSRSEARGVGGAALSFSPLTHLVMGGGGGAGHGQDEDSDADGGHGGGIIFVRALSIGGTGTLDASGAAGAGSAESGGGGGGAGGTIHVRTVEHVACAGGIGLNALGGGGGDSDDGDPVVRGPGGGGGGGRILVQAVTANGCAVTSNVSNGIAGSAVGGGHAEATPQDNAFPHTGLATFMQGALAAPAAPVIAPATTVTTNNPLPTLTGTGTPGTEVVIYQRISGVPNGPEFGRAAVGTSDSPTAFSVTLSRALPTGNTVLVAVAEAQGLQGLHSNPVTYTLDTAAPDTHFLANGTPTSPSRLENAVFQFASNETTGITFQCVLQTGDIPTPPAVDAGAWLTTPCSGTGTHTTGTLTDDETYTFWVRARDAAGNVDPAPSRYAWRVDRARPTTAFATDGKPPVDFNQAVAVFRFESNEDPVTFQCARDDSATTEAPAEGSAQWQDCAASHLTPASTYVTAPLGAGTYTLWVRAKDVAGNVDDAPQHHTWTVDLTPPDTELFGTLPEALNNANSVVFTFRELPSGSANDFECSLNGAAFSACESGDTFATPGDATYTFLVRARDAAGNVDPAPASHTWRTDKSLPDTSVSTSVGTLSNAPRAGFEFNSPASDVAGFQCVLETGATTQAPAEGSTLWEDCAASYLTPVLTDGTYTLWVRAKDAAGNVDTAPQHHTWTVDLTPPDTELFGTLPEAVNNANAAVLTFRALPVGDASDFECSLNGATFSACESGDSFPTPDDATYSVLVRARDPAGNVDPTPASYTWRRDRTRPATELIALVGALSNAPRAGFEFNSPASDVAGFQCVLDNSATTQAPVESSSRWEDCAASYLTPVLTDGTYTLWVRAKDAAGNVDDAPLHHTWTVDLTPPDTELFGTLPEAVNNANAAVLTFRALPVGDASDFECSLNGATFSTCESGDSFPTPGDATYSVLVRARDPAGNVDLTPASYTWRTDKTRPATELSTLVGVLSNAPRALFTLTSSATDVAGFQCVLETGATTQAPAEGSTSWEDCAASYLTPVLTDGTYTLWVRAKDAAGNVDNAPRHHTWTVDLTPPDTQIDSKPDILTNQLTATFVFSASEPGVRFECSYDGGAYFACTSPYALPNAEFPLITEGDHRMLIRAIDEAGNPDDTPALHIWTVVVGEVQTNIVPVSLSNPTRSTTATFSFTSNLSNVVYYCQLDGSPYEQCADSANAVKVYENLAEGSHSLNVKAAEGEFEDQSPAPFNWTIDLTPPVAPTLTSPSADVVYVNVRTPRFEGVAPDDESLTDGTLSVYRGVQLVDSVEDIRANALWAFDFPVSLPDGEYTLLFSFTDKAGNTGATTSRTFTVDATRPVTTLTVNPGDLTNQAQATFEFTSNEAESTFACSVNGAGFSACTSPHTVSVGDASHEFVVRAVDRAGNVANVVGTHSWRVDTVEPSTSIVAKPDVDTNVPSAEFRFESNEAPILYECSLDDAAFVECATPYLLSDLSEGAHRLVVRARDEATNVDTTAEEHVWRVDMTPPLAPEITAPAPDGVVGSLTPTFQGSAEPGSQLVLFVDGVERGVAPVEPSGQWRLTLTTAISEGPHTVSALARDAAQNAGPESQASAFTVDPSINIVREVSSRGGGLSCAAGGEGHVPLVLLGWACLALMAARRRRV